MTPALIAARKHLFAASVSAKHRRNEVVTIPFPDAVQILSLLDLLKAADDEAEQREEGECSCCGRCGDELVIAVCATCHQLENEEVAR